jgi:1-pyrroline-5-carboxylate dehydrogenase
VNLDPVGTSIPQAHNEPVLNYAPGSAERTQLEKRLKEMAGERPTLPHIIGGRDVPSDETTEYRAPHDHAHVLCDASVGQDGHIRAAIGAAKKARSHWAATSFTDRAAVFLRAAEMLATTWRPTINASTMLGQSKSVFQSEIDAACEMADFWRFNCVFAERLYADQPLSGGGIWNRMDYRPLEGFVLAISPFNFTSIGGNLACAPALMGNTVVWKPSDKQVLSAHFTMKLLEEAGLPDGVINLVLADAEQTVDAAMSDPDFAGLHFTGSTDVFRSIWSKAATNLKGLHAYPRLVGETGGKNFVVAHPSADPRALSVALARGAFEYQGQKCSAASRAYIPRSLWEEMRDDVCNAASSMKMGDVADLSTFLGAVIDEKAFNRIASAIDEAKSRGESILAGGESDRSEGWFIRPTIIETKDPKSDTMVRELFGPVLTVFVYEDSSWDETLDLAANTGPYGLTGSIFSTDRTAVAEATVRLRDAAGNFYVNDKPTGAVVGQQPFGGARGSGTNDKAGSMWNLIRWVSPRTIKETLAPPTDWRYPHQG